MEQRINIVTVLVAVLGAVKIVLQAFGLDIINDEQINAIANGVAALVTIFGVVMSHRKATPTDTRTQPFDGYKQVPFDGTKSS